MGMADKGPTDHLGYKAQYEFVAFLKCCMHKKNPSLSNVIKSSLNLCVPF